MHPIAFQIGGVAIYWYGILVAAGFLAAIWTASRRAPEIGIHSEVVVDLAPWLLLGAIAGARLWYVATYWQEEFSGKPFWEIFMVRRSGLVFYGGFVGASLATILYAKAKKASLWKVADILAPSVALGHAFGRMGCLMTGCCFGKPTSLPWAIRFPQDHWTHGAAVHPTQIYEAALNLALFAGLIWLFRRKKFDGQVFAVYLMSYAALRAVVELFRGDYPNYFLGGLATPAHGVSLLIFVIGISLFWKLQQRPRSGRPKHES